MQLPKESSAIAALASIMCIRMLGLFMILPVFSLYAEKIPGATAALVGVTLGIYGLTQACFQIPFGMLSDRIGRKPVIFAGLCLLILGSVICALSHSIYFLILGRALQGTGAIGSTVLALVADLTRDATRGKAMAFIGLAIGFAFVIAMIVGPTLNHWFHLSGIFWATGLLAFMGMTLLLIVPTPQKPLKTSEKIGTKLLSLLKNTTIARLNFGIFALHTILTSLFIAIPILLHRDLLLSESKQIILYVTVLLSAFIFAVPMISRAERKRKIKSTFIIAISTILFVQVIFYSLQQTALITTVLLFAFFAAFTVLEALLPSFVSKTAPVQNKGAAMGLYSTCQFLGIFAGGSLGGLIFSHDGIFGIFAFCAGIAAVWCIIAILMKQPNYLATIVLPLEYRDEIYHNLKKLTGVAEIAVASKENLVYIKVDKQKISEPELRNAIIEGNLAKAN